MKDQLLSAMSKMRFVHVFSLTGFLLAFGWFYTYGLIMSPQQRSDSKEINIAMITLVTGIAGFWVGSSSGSARKDATIAALSPGTPSPVTVQSAQNVNAGAQDTTADAIQNNTP